MRLMDMLDCTVVGDVLMDVVVHGKSYLGDLVPSGTSYCNFSKIEFGGSGNVAVGLSVLGGRAAFLGKAGNDFFGRLYVRDLKKRGVIPRVVFDKSLPTGIVIVFLDERKERSFLVFRGANDRMSPEEIEKASFEIERSRYVYFSGYSLVSHPQEDAVLRAVDLARRHKVKIVFDPGAHNIVKSKRRLFTKLLSLCDVFSPNLEEASAITNTTHFEDIVEKLREKVPFTALKLGKEGSFLISGKDTVNTRGLRVRCVDTTGAGDAFIAAIIYGLSRKFSTTMIGRVANWFSAQTVTQIGSRSFPSKSKILNFLHSS